MAGEMNSLAAICLTPSQPLPRLIRNLYFFQEVSTGVGRSLCFDSFGVEFSSVFQILGNLVNIVIKPERNLLF